jgi:hypothetical protein
MESGIKARECNLSAILAPGNELRMPPYQRSYAWEANEVHELLEDLRRTGRRKRFHFVGAIVLVEMDDGTYLVVDGQQRLTTISMILAVLRDLEPDPHYRALVHAMIGDPDKANRGEATAWRLTLNPVDNPYFREAVQTEGATLERDVDAAGTSNHERMARNLDFIETYLKALPAKDRRQLFETIRDRIMLVRVAVPDWDGGYDVFRVLNTRGKVPNNHDIIKTEILQRGDFSVEEAGTYARQWLDHESMLGGNGFDDLLNYIRQLHTRSSKGKVTTEFVKSVLSKVDARTFLDERLPDYVDAYKVVLGGEPDYGGHSAAVKVPLDHLRLLDHHLWRVPALAYLYKDEGNGETAADFFRLLERFGYAMMLYVTNSDARRKQYARLTKAILDGKPLFHRNGPLNFSKEDSRKIRERLTGRFSNFMQRRALALRLNAALENGEQISSEQDATVEHVLPKAVPEGSYWNTLWPSGTAQRELCETVGNFVIVPRHVNRGADRLDFREKKKLYFADGVRVFALTEDLRERDTWTPDDVRERTEQLVDILMNIWFPETPAS